MEQFLHLNLSSGINYLSTAFILGAIILCLIIVIVPKEKGHLVIVFIHGILDRLPFRSVARIFGEYLNKRRTRQK